MFIYNSQRPGKVFVVHKTYIMRLQLPLKNSIWQCPKGDGLASSPSNWFAGCGHETQYTSRLCTLYQTYIQQCVTLQGMCP